MRNSSLTITRHGESKANRLNDLHPEDRFFGGDGDYELTDTGRRQAEDLRRHFQERGIVFDRVLCSPLQRAQETAHIITGGAQTIETFDALVERRLGQISGHTSSQVCNVFPALRDHIIRDPSLRHLRESFTTYPETGVESYAQVVQRLQEGLPLPDPESGEHFLVVGHKHANRALLHLLLRRGKTDECVTTSLNLPNAHPIELEMLNGHWRHTSGLDPWPYDDLSRIHLDSHDVRGMHSTGPLKSSRRARP